MARPLVLIQMSVPRLSEHLSPERNMLPKPPRVRRSELAFSRNHQRPSVDRLCSVLCVLEISAGRLLCPAVGLHGEFDALPRFLQ
jgi:hypothetical protein